MFGNLTSLPRTVSVTQLVGHLDIDDPLNSILLVEIHIKLRHFPREAPNQTCMSDCNFRKLEEDAEVNRAISTFLLVEIINKLERWLPSGKHMYASWYYRKLSDRCHILNANFMYGYFSVFYLLLALTFIVQPLVLISPVFMSLLCFNFILTIFFCFHHVFIVRFIVHLFNINFS